MTAHRFFADAKRAEVPSDEIIKIGDPAILAAGTTVPSGVAGYATGCYFAHTDGGDATSGYINEGTSTSCSFTAVASV